jgi:hypothetical protein
MDKRTSDKVSRRTLLKQLSALGLLGPAGIVGLIQEVLAKGDMPTVPGINTLQGTATVNGREGKIGTPVRPGDRVVTGKASQAVVVVDGDAFLLRENTDIDFKQSSGVLETVQVVSGKILSVFSKRRENARLMVKVPVGTIGIRGTGMYIETEETRVYFCLCYGEAAVDGKNMATRMVKTTHHESPLFLYEGADSMQVEAGPFRNHTDAELIMLEALCGREPPFMGKTYPGQKY